LSAFGVWRDMDRFYEEFTGAGVLDRVLSGAFEVTGGTRWEAWQISATPAELEELLAVAPGIRVTGRYAPAEYSIAGEAAACGRAIARTRVKAQRVNYDLVIHCEEFAPYASEWYSLHDRESFASPVHFYAHASRGRYTPERSAVARALTDQALAP